MHNEVLTRQCPCPVRWTGAGNPGGGRERLQADRAGAREAGAHGGEKQRHQACRVHQERHVSGAVPPLACVHALPARRVPLLLLSVYPPPLRSCSKRLEGNVKKFQGQQEQVKGEIAALQKAKAEGA